MAAPPTLEHKPRRKRKDHLATTAPEFPLAAFLWPARVNVSQWALLPLILMVVALFRWSTALWPYSGYQSPPMFGDFEAQRHWMEITSNLPIMQWYFYDLHWWGLDYPPLTAYHSWIIGKLGQRINPAWFELHKSRGVEDPLLKLFMRATVLTSEYLTYIPAAVLVVRRISHLEAMSAYETSIALVALLMQPATLLIDHGHFQYNTVMLGFTLASIAAMLSGSVRWACFFFVGALGFKQMALFYAPAVFAYLLSICLLPRPNIGRFLSVALITVASFGLLFAPILLGSSYNVYRGNRIGDFLDPPLLSKLPMRLDPENILHMPVIQLAQSIHRIFPFARGIFEDKVANVWCALHTFHKLHHYPTAMVQRATLLATSAFILPPCLIIFLKPRKDLLPLAFAATSWGFFLCSYQVHEKNVLLPLLPMTLLLCSHGGLLPYTRSWVGFANILGTWTMFPLLRREGLQIPYFVHTTLWAFLLGLPPASLSIYRSSESRRSAGLLTGLIHVPVYMAMVAWHFCLEFVPPPAAKPDLWIVANVLVGAAGFGICYLWCLISLAQKAGYLRGAIKSKVQ